RTGGALRHGAAVLPRTPESARGQRPRAIAQGRPRQNIRARARAAQTCGGLAWAPAHAVGTPPRSTRQLSDETEGRGVQMTSSIIKIDPKLDLVLEREIDVPVELVWRAWTTPEHLREWFAPKPWTITACDLDLRPGGAINFTMSSPDGQLYPNTQCYLEVTPFERLIITDTLLGGYRPSS